MAHSSDDAAERERNELNALLKQALEERERLLAEREALLKERARLLKRPTVRIPCLAHVFISPKKASRQSRPKSLRVPPEILRLVTW
jgi:hypothetical protein